MNRIMEVNKLNKLKKVEIALIGIALVYVVAVLIALADFGILYLHSKMSTYVFVLSTFVLILSVRHTHHVLNHEKE